MGAAGTAATPPWKFLSLGPNDKGPTKRGCKKHPLNPPGDKVARQLCHVEHKARHNKRPPGVGVAVQNVGDCYVRMSNGELRRV